MRYLILFPILHLLRSRSKIKEIYSLWSPSDITSLHNLHCTFHFHLLSWMSRSFFLSLLPVVLDWYSDPLPSLWDSDSSLEKSSPYLASKCWLEAGELSRDSFPRIIVVLSVRSSISYSPWTISDLRATSPRLQTFDGALKAFSY